MEKVTFVQKVVIKHPTNPERFLLLVRNQNDKSRPGDYDIPGGSVKEGELHEEALLREVTEETGLKIKELVPVVIKSNIDEGTRKYFLYIGYSAVAMEDDVILNPEEHSTYIWLSAKEFREKVPNHILQNQIDAIYPTS